MKNVKWSFVLLLIVMAVVSGVSLSCSSDEFDLPTEQKTMARRKSLGGGDEYNLIPNSTFVEIKLPDNLCTLDFNINWAGGRLERPYPRVSPVGEKFNNIKWTSQNYAAIQIGNNSYTNVSVANGEIELSQCSFNFENFDVSAKIATIFYTIPYTVTLQSTETIDKDSTQNNGQNKGVSIPIRTYPPVSDVCQGTINISVDIEHRGY